MKVLAFTKYSKEGPSSRYRFYNYQNCFKKSGIDLDIKPLFGKEYFIAPSKSVKLLIVIKAYFIRFLQVFGLLLSPKYDLILIEYELFPYFPALFEWLFRKRGIKYLVDYDDAIFHKYDLSSNLFIKLFLKNKIAKVIKNADYVIACNSYLEQYAKRYNGNILRLYTVVLLDRYKEEMKHFKKSSNRFVIGWIGSRTTSVYILDILPAIEKFVNKYSDVKFNLVGFDKNLLSQNDIKKYHFNIIEWSQESEIKDILEFDIGIMPLSNTPWSRGKCGFKLVQYMSCKKPVIASPVGVNCDIVEEEINGFLANDMDEWFKYFEKLYLDSELRENMSKANILKIEEEFSYNKNCSKYTNLIKKLGLED